MKVAFLSAVTASGHRYAGFERRAGTDLRGKELILRTHPLLQMDRIAPPRESDCEHAEWLEALHKKVLAFTEAFAAHGHVASRSKPIKH